MTSNENISDKREIIYLYCFKDSVLVEKSELLAA